MRRRLLADPKPQASPPQDLHPTLQAALESLDVQLDNELARYRRMRARLANPSAQTPQPPPPLLEATAAAATGNHRIQFTDRPAPRTAQAAALSPAALAIATPPAPAPLPNNPPQSAPLPLLSLNPEPAQNLAETEENLGPDDYLESSEHLLRSLAEEEAELRRAEHEPGMLESLLTPLGIGSMLLLILSSITFGYLVMNPASLTFLSGNAGGDRQQPISSTATNPPTADPNSTSAASEVPLSPNLATQEFPDVTLDTLSTLPKDGEAEVPTASPAAPTASPAVSPAVRANSAAVPRTVSEPPAVSVAPAPPRSPQASSESRSSRTPSTARSQSASRESTSRSASASRSQTTARSSEPRPSRPQSSSRASESRSSTPRAAAAPVSAPPSRADAASERPTAAAPVYYYVVADYSGDRSLEAARRNVSQAYVRNFDNGAKIQFGAFTDASRARGLVQQLQGEGISARIYQPD